MNARERGGASINVTAALRQVFVMVVIPIVFGYLIGALVLAGCGSSFADLEDAAKNGDQDAALKLCRADARSAFYVEKKSEAESLARFDACVKRIK